MNNESLKMRVDTLNEKIEYLIIKTDREYQKNRHLLKMIISLLEKNLLIDPSTAT